MLRAGHVGLAALCWTALAAHAMLPERRVLALVGGVACVWLAPVPDVDHSLPRVPHRGPTHSLAFAALVAVGVGAATVVLPSAARAAGLVEHGWTVATSLGLEPSLAHLPAVDVLARTLALAAGVALVSHLLADALTPAGVPLLWPLTAYRFSLGVVGAGNPLANYGALAAGVGATVLLLTGRGTLLAELLEPLPALGLGR